MAQVGTPEIEQTAQYVQLHAKELQQLAQQTRPDLLVEVLTGITQTVLLRSSWHSAGPEHACGY